MGQKPKLRAVEAIPVELRGEQLICLRDPSGISNQTAVLPPRAFFVAALCDGEHTLRDIQTEYTRRFGDLLFTENLEEIIRQLDDAFLMEGEQFEAHRCSLMAEFARSPVRRAAHAGTAYPAQPEALREALGGFFRAPEGPGEIEPDAGGAEVVGIAAPHIDLRRGGVTYAHAYRALAERCAAETFVILGIAHQGGSTPFIMTDKNFETPLGVVECDHEFTRALVRRSGLDAGPDELIHKHEHSIEFQAVFLRYVFGASRPVRIVPVLCGPLLPLVGEVTDPLAVEPIGNFVRALKDLLGERAGKAAVIAAVDLSHVGRRFGDAVRLSPSLLQTVEAEDRALVKWAEQVNAAGFLETNRRNNDRRHVCGVPALYVLLSVTRAHRGRLLHYGQAPDANTQSVVSFAAMAFEKQGGPNKEGDRDAHAENRRKP